MKPKTLCGKQIKEIGPFKVDFHTPKIDMVDYKTLNRYHTAICIGIDSSDNPDKCVVSEFENINGEWIFKRILNSEE